jgi:hypothetical protein
VSAPTEDVSAACIYDCGKGAIYVPEVGPMGDDFCLTVAEAQATGRIWRYEDEFGGFMCPDCDAMMLADWPYVWFWRCKLGERKGLRCRVWARGTMNSIGVEFLDGFRTVTARYAIRLARPA